jgi:hypothetical protein
MIEQLIGELVFVETVPDIEQVGGSAARCAKCIFKAEHDALRGTDHEGGCFMDVAEAGPKFDCSPHARADKRTGHFELRFSAPGVPNKAQVEMFFDSEEAEG